MSYPTRARVVVVNMIIQWWFNTRLICHKNPNKQRNFLKTCQFFVQKIGLWNWNFFIWILTFLNQWAHSCEFFFKQLMLYVCVCVWLVRSSDKTNLGVSNLKSMGWVSCDVWPLTDKRWINKQCHEVANIRKLTTQEAISGSDRVTRLFWCQKWIDNPMPSKASPLKSPYISHHDQHLEDVLTAWIPLSNSRHPSLSVTALWNLRDGSQYL